jgi:heme exporter protein B
MLAWRQFWAILRKDLLIDLRRKENVTAMFFFALLTLVTFQFAGGGLTEPRYRVTARILASLKGQGWTETGLAALRPLVGRTFADQSGLFTGLGGDQAAQLSDAERVALVSAARGNALQDLAPGFVWVAVLLAGVLGLDKSFGQERENGCMDGLLLSPAGRGVIFLAKMAANLLFLLVIVALLLPLSSLLFHLSVWDVWLALSGVVAATLLGFAALGTLLAGLVATLRGKEVLLPVLLFPLLAPLLIAVVQVTAGLLEGQPLDELARWLSLIAGFDAVYLILAFLAFEFVVES